MKTLEEWKIAIEKMSSLSRERMDTKEFFRQPARPLINDPSRMFSPADGVLIYCKRVASPLQPVLDAKGSKVSVRDLTRLESLTGGCTVAGVFMTQWDVHSNCMPYPGAVNYRNLPTIDTHNYPMLVTEQGLLQGIVKKTEDYQHKNERMLNTIYNAALDYTFYIVQIADSDVDVITPFSTFQWQHYSQCQRFSFIRFGSQCDLILPEKEGLRFKPLLKPLCHVEGGIDPLFEIIR